MQAKTRILTSLALLTGLVGVSIGATFALFSSSKTVNNHIRAGSLKVGFYLNELVVDTLTEKGQIAPVAADLTGYSGYDAGLDAVDLSVYSGEVISVEKFCPSMEGAATFTVTNLGDIAFDYELVVINKAAEYEDGTDATDGFDDVMHIEMVDEEGSLEVGDEAVHVLSFQFDAQASNEWQEANFTFDIQLVAVQVANSSTSSSH